MARVCQVQELDNVGLTAECFGKHKHFLGDMRLLMVLEGFGQELVED